MQGKISILSAMVCYKCSFVGIKNDIFGKFVKKIKRSLSKPILKGNGANSARYKTKNKASAKYNPVIKGFRSRTGFQ